MNGIFQFILPTALPKQQIFIPTTMAEAAALAAQQEARTTPTFHPDELTKLSILAFTRAFKYSWYQLPVQYYLEYDRVLHEDSKKVGKVSSVICDHS